MSTRSTIVTLILSSALSGVAAPAAADDAPAPPDTVEVDRGGGDPAATARTYLAMGLSVAALLGLLLLVVLLARAGDPSEVHTRH
jgi:hypothetical protein